MGLLQLQFYSGDIKVRILRCVTVGILQWEYDSGNITVGIVQWGVTLEILQWGYYSADCLNVSTITTSGCVKFLLTGKNLVLQTYGVLS